MKLCFIVDKNKQWFHSDKNKKSKLCFFADTSWSRRSATCTVSTAPQTRDLPSPPLRSPESEIVFVLHSLSERERFQLSSSPSHLLSRRLSMRSRHPLHRQDYTQGLGSFYVNVFICIAVMLMSTHISNFGKFLALSANFVCKLEGMTKHMLLWRGGVPKMGKMQQISNKFFFLCLYKKLRTKGLL